MAISPNLSQSPGTNNTNRKILIFKSYHNEYYIQLNNPNTNNQKVKDLNKFQIKAILKDYYQEKRTILSLDIIALFKLNLIRNHCFISTEQLMESTIVEINIIKRECTPKIYTEPKRDRVIQPTKNKYYVPKKRKLSQL